MDSSDIVFTQNSTVGIEAAAAGKPVFYTGRNLFEHCRSVRRIMDDGDLSSALDISPAADPVDALRYANFFGEHGIPYRYYEPRGFLSGKYHGTDLNGPLSRIRDLKLRLTRGGT
jgi:capsule polysaccharide modification protein KpsS